VDARKQRRTWFEIMAMEWLKTLPWTGIFTPSRASGVAEVINKKGSL
jgi:hypothetical protein